MTNVLLATSNGTGMGHLTRQAAVGLALAGEHQATLFSLSIGLPLAMGLGLNGEYAPSYDRPWIASRAWNGYLRDRLSAIIEETSSDVVLFDGVAVYPGIGHASSRLRDVAFIWLRRGLWRKGTGIKQLRRASYFDRVIEPGDLGGDLVSGPTAGLSGVTHVAPISLVEVLGLMPRAEARSILGLPDDREVALVTLGSGRLGDVTGPGEIAVRALLEESDFHVAITRSAVAANEVLVDRAERVTVLRDIYPLARYLNAFDLAVSSAGYNAVHELVPSGVPTLFVANTSTRTDDQEARSMRIATLGLGLHASDNDPAGVETGMRCLLDPALRADLGAAAADTISTVKGARETGTLVTTLGASFTHRRPSLSVAMGERFQEMKDAVKGVLGEERTRSLKRALGRQPTPIASRTRVRLTDQIVESSEEPLPLLVTDHLDGGVLRRPTPVEHILQGSSQGYREQRLDMIHTYYDVV